MTELEDFIEDYRARQIARLFEMQTFSTCWSTWEPSIRRLTKDLTDADAIYDLGSRLSDIFRSTGGKGRTQDSLSGGGAAWEALVCWYLNLIFVGTNAIAFKQNRKLLPKCIFDAATVTYGNHQTNTESDISVIVLPEHCSVPLGKTSPMEKYESMILQDFSSVTLGIIQCKTNWNDNAQIPMLWDMVYRGEYAKNTGITVGRNGRSVKHLNFSYSFVVVPSQKKGIRANSVPTIRVTSLSGGNYWGQPTLSGVALCLSEIFMRNFGQAFTKSVPDTIRSAIHRKIGPYA